MVHGGTHAPEIPGIEPTRIKSKKENCEDRGGVWDEATQTCSLDKKPEPPRVDPSTPETIRDVKTGEVSGVTLPNGRTFLGLNADQVEQIALAREEKLRQPKGTVAGGTAQEQATKQFEGQQLAGQVGEFEQLGVSPTGLDLQEAAIEGVISGIPNSLKVIGAAIATGGVIGAAVGGPAAPVTATAGAVIGGVIASVGAISGSIISSFKGQRRDTTTAQQRVLDEGKQTMNDWVTLAKNDPGKRAFYLGQYNNVASQIDQAYRQMKLDTSQDVAKFETALPNLAEFEAFYSIGGERDALDREMTNSLTAISPEGLDMVELSQRRGNGNK